VRWLFAPGARVMLRLSNQQKLPLISALFLLPLVLLYWETGEHASTALRLCIGWGVALALYSMGSFYLQADMGWRILIAAMERISRGDLTSRVEAKLGGHFGVVIRMLEQINESLGDIVRQVRAGALAVAGSARDIAEASGELSRRTDRQASTLEQTASAMEELAATVRHNADNCTVATQQAREASEVASNGSQVVHGVVEAMGAIDGGSRRIAEIVDVIEGIAFQTNILALNAAVEAARAGDQGRGFAVVAAEVRALAQRSAEAAKEVRQLIERSVAQVKDGGRRAESAGRAIDDIVAGVQRAHNAVGEIAEASTEQSASLQEINRALGQLEDVTQQNAAMVQEAAARTAEFQQAAERLMNVVSRFKVKEAERAEPAGPKPARAVPPRALVLPSKVGG